MRADPHVELVIARFTLTRKDNNTSVTCHRKMLSPKGSLNNLEDWYIDSVACERAQMQPDAIVKFADYRIVSRDVELFEYAGVRFDKVALILGEENTHWHFYNKAAPLQEKIVGQANLGISYCVGCFELQYAKVFKAIKKAL